MNVQRREIWTAGLARRRRSAYETGVSAVQAARRALVITPTYDERANLEAFVARLFRYAPETELLVVDDASPDGTGAVAEALARDDRRVHVIHRARKQGLGSAYLEGFAWALSRSFDAVVQMDADLSHDARHLPAFFRALEAGADLVVGSRGVAGGGVVGWGPARRFLSWSGSAYARGVLDVETRDLTTGFKAFSRQALERIEPASLRCEGYAFQIETTHRALDRGLAVCELPIVFTDRRVGRSKLDRRVLLEAVVAPWRMRFDRRRR